MFVMLGTTFVAVLIRITICLKRRGRLCWRGASAARDCPPTRNTDEVGATMWATVGKVAMMAGTTSTAKLHAPRRVTHKFNPNDAAQGRMVEGVVASADVGLAIRAQHDCLKQKQKKKMRSSYSRGLTAMSSGMNAEFQKTTGISSFLASSFSQWNVQACTFRLRVTHHRTVWLR